MGRLSLYPFAAVAAARTGRAIGVDMDAPAHFRTGYSADTRELYVAWDIGLTPEKPVARVGGCTFAFPSAWGFRAALAAYYGLFPGHFRTRIARQGVWMPFAKISALPDWQDFGFRFKEGNDETAWDDAHDVLTFRYTEPLTWWMALPRSAPRTLDAARAEARRLAPDPANAAAQAFLTSVFHDEAGSPPARILDTPWCNGAVWSMNSAPGVAGAHTDFRNKWNPALRAQLYGAARKAELDGEYVDSSEGYVTAVLDFRREHFAAAEAPLTFSPDSHRPAVYRGLMAWEYARAIATDMHAEGRYMMANATPYRLCWLAPLLDVMGTETDWNPGGRWRPMSREDLFYRRALCAGKPYCLLMNTDFKRFPLALTERYMQRCLAYGMLPGFFSADASTGHYFTRPELYERDRGLFRRYVPLCRRVAEAGWQPVTRARTNLPDVGVERFGTRYMTLFNDGADACRVTVTLDEEPPAAAVRELLAGASQAWTNRTATLSLGPEAVAVLDLMPK